MRLAGVNFMLIDSEDEKCRIVQGPPKHDLHFVCSNIHQADNLNWFRDKYTKTSGWKYKYTFEKYVWNSVWEILPTDTHLLPWHNPEDLTSAFLEGTLTSMEIQSYVTHESLPQPPSTMSNLSPSSQNLLLPSRAASPPQRTSWTPQSWLRRCLCCSTPFFSFSFFLFFSSF